MTSPVHSPPAPPEPAPMTRHRWWRRPWMAPLGVVTVVFLAFSVPPYLTGDPALSRVPAPEGFGAHYPLLVLHVMFASVSMVTAFLQVWPWFRQRYQTAHRYVGRVYVFAGVLPAGLSGLVIGVNTPFGPVLAASNVMLGLLWLAFTAAGYRMARQRRFVEHRRWMLRSFALTFSIIANRIWIPIFMFTLTPQLDTTFQGNATLLTWTVSGLSGWLSWVIVLLGVEWWIERGDAAKRRRTRARAAA